MIADLPRTEEINEETDKELSPQTSEEFKDFINQINKTNNL